MELKVVLFVIWYLAFVVSTVFHEAGHALAARVMGDNTSGNQVTLDPTPHMRREPVGMIVVPILSYLLNGFMMGWASAPYDPEWAYRHPRRASKMALAGPLCNLSLAIWAALLLRLGLHFGVFDALALLNWGWANPAQILDTLLMIMLNLNLILFGFNLLPVPPLDGATVAGLFLSESTARSWQSICYKPTYQFAAWLLASLIFNWVVRTPLLMLEIWMLTA